MMFKVKTCGMRRGGADKIGSGVLCSLRRLCGLDMGKLLIVHPGMGAFLHCALLRWMIRGGHRGMFR